MAPYGVLIFDSDEAAQWWLSLEQAGEVNGWWKLEEISSEAHARWVKLMSTDVPSPVDPQEFFQRMHEVARNPVLLVDLDDGEEIIGCATFLATMVLGQKVDDGSFPETMVSLALNSRTWWYGLIGDLHNAAIALNVIQERSSRDADHFSEYHAARKVVLRRLTRLLAEAIEIMDPLPDGWK